ncbi:MAG: hypothetical protein A2Y40_00275 [Candidatus Margulisbacteria bacterium GWF2_35_9]|nr:MAG: hypothetical protein A2Y40_00275 [Candidatus Margulisbacteria bacterium GWF2_35_9]
MKKLVPAFTQYKKGGFNMKKFVPAFLVALTLSNMTFSWDPYPGFYLGDNHRVVNNGYEIGMTLTKPFENVRWALEGNLGLIASSKLLFSSGLNMVYNLVPYQSVTPYLFVGVGGDIGENNFWMNTNLGAGVKFFIAPDWMYSLQTKWVWYGERANSEWLIAGILNIPIGESAKILDVDGDGVPNYRDKFPDTPARARVDSRGSFLGLNLNINFDTDKDIVDESYSNELKAFAQYLRNHPEQRIEIQGHTDNQLAVIDKNLDLSFRRATSVAKILTVKYGVPKDQLSVNGYGATRPLVANDTEDHRAMNRRIEAVLVK